MLLLLLLLLLLLPCGVWPSEWLPAPMLSGMFARRFTRALMNPANVKLYDVEEELFMKRVNGGCLGLSSWLRCDS